MVYSQGVADIQLALRSFGFDPGPVDGVRGRRTIRATKDFQRAHGLLDDGIVGPRTAAVLFRSAPSVPVTDPSPWFTEAKRLLGTLEVPGKPSNPVILDWADGLGIDYPSDDIPWCGLFTAHCIGSQLPEEPLPTNPLAARSWTSWGTRTTPRRGAVLVFWRGRIDGWQGHVGFYHSHDRDTYHVLGGNQSDSVSVAKIAKGRLLGAYWPSTAATAGEARDVSMELRGAISENEA